jgi:hypothetical protein
MFEIKYVAIRSTRTVAKRRRKSGFGSWLVFNGIDERRGGNVIENASAGTEEPIQTGVGSPDSDRIDYYIDYCIKRSLVLVNG